MDADCQNDTSLVISLPSEDLLDPDASEITLFGPRRRNSAWTGTASGGGTLLCPRLWAGLGRIPGVEREG